MSWIDTLVHPNMRFWETGAPMPRDKASLKQWSRYESETSTVLEHELLPISATVTGNVAVVQYYYREARDRIAAVTVQENPGLAPGFPDPRRVAAGAQRISSRCRS
jgi:hypothetical protein